VVVVSESEMEDAEEETVTEMEGAEEETGTAWEPMETTGGG